MFSKKRVLPFKSFSISCRIYSPLQTVNFSCSISMRTNQNYINVNGGSQTSFN